MTPRRFLPIMGAAVMFSVLATADVSAFVEATGSLPQNVNWAIKGPYVLSLFDAPPRLPGAPSRSDAIKRTLAATCLIEVQVGE